MGVLNIRGVGVLNIRGRGLAEPETLIEDFKFVVLRCVTLGVGPQLLQLRAVFHCVGIQAPGYKT